MYQLIRKNKLRFKNNGQKKENVIRLKYDLYLD